MIRSAGGEEVQEKNKLKASFIILDEKEDKKEIAKLKGQKGVPPVCSVEVLFDGIIHQKFDFKKFSILKWRLYNNYIFNKQ